MANAEKTAAVAEITEHFKSATAAVVTEYRGLTVKQMSDLRRALGRETTYAVVKNTLTKRAATEAGVAIDESLLVGPTAIAFITGDPVDAAKGLRDFARANPMLIVKGGLMEGSTLSAAEVARIADLESREVLLSKLASALIALPARAAATLHAPLSQMARLVAALEPQKQKGSAGANQSSTSAPARTGGDRNGESDTDLSSSSVEREASIPLEGGPFDPGQQSTETIRQLSHVQGEPSAQQEPDSATHFRADEHRGSPVLEADSYNDGTASFFSLRSGPESHEADEFVAIEAHQGYFSLAWSTDLPAGLAVAEIMDVLRESPSANARAMLIKAGVREDLRPDDAIELALSADDVTLLRIELEDCALVWSSASNPQQLAEIGIIWARRGRLSAADVMRSTASRTVSEGATYFADRAFQVVGDSLP